MPRHGPRKKEPAFPDGGFDGIETCHLESLRIPQGGVVGTMSALEANDCSIEPTQLGEVFRSEGPRHISVQQGLNHLGLQHADFQRKGGGRPIILLRSELIERCPHETGTSVSLEREVGAFVDDAAQV